MVDLSDSGSRAAYLRTLHTAQTKKMAQLFGRADDMRRVFSVVHDHCQCAAACIDAAGGEYAYEWRSGLPNADRAAGTVSRQTNDADVVGKVLAAELGA